MLAIALCALVPFLTGCKDKAKEERMLAIREIMHGNTPNPEFAAALQKAKDTKGEFLSALQKPAPGQTNFLVKKTFPAEGGKQQILWVDKVTYDGKLIHGVVADNTAVRGSGIPFTGAVSFPPEEIADWMFNDNGKAAGGWTMRAFKKLFPEEWGTKPNHAKIQFRE